MINTPKSDLGNHDDNYGNHMWLHQMKKVQTVPSKQNPGPVTVVMHRDFFTIDVAEKEVSCSVTQLSKFHQFNLSKYF